MPSFTTTKELSDALKRLYGPPDEGTVKPLKYVIYARKSTDDSEKQARSLGDQITECMDFAERHNLLIGTPKVIQESVSAKQSDKRVGFRGMLEDIRNKKYDAILAWHPDRLARNLKDAGEIVDLLDKGVIKDLKFVSFNFENTPSGLMHLGITFVIAKQYSDQLSQNVSRGIEHSIEDGYYINRPKHGYFKDSEQRLRPDGRNFDLIKQAFQLRLQNMTLDEIAEWLNKNHYERAYADGSHKSFHWRNQMVVKTLRDPVYAGVVAYGEGNIADLTAIYDFQVAISVEDFMRVNALSNDKALFKLARSYRKGENVKADLLRGMILCAECGDIMSAGITTKREKRGIVRYFYYRCDTEGCPLENKSVRAKVIVDYVNSFLARKPFSSKAAYDHYIAEMGRVQAGRSTERRVLLRSLQGTAKALATKEQNIKDLIIEQQKDPQFVEGFKGDLAKVDKERKSVAGDIERLEGLIAAEKDATVLMPEFLELMDKIAQTIATTEKMTELDFCVRKIFSNFSVRGKNVVNATLSEPFARLADPNSTIGAR